MSTAAAFAGPVSDHYQNVPGFPGWVAWLGLYGVKYARYPQSSPPLLVRAGEWWELPEAIRAEFRRRRDLATACARPPGE